MTHEEIAGAVMGALLLRNLDAYPQTFDVFSTRPVEAFGTRQDRDIYREIMRQALSKNVIDPVLVGEALGGEYQAIMSASVKLSWAIANLEQYASLVVKNHFIRSAEEVVANAITALDGARTGDESMTAIAELRESLQHMELNSGELVAVHINDLLAGVETRLEERMAGVGEGRTLLTGIDELDALTGGFDLTDLVLIAARPSVGKTEFALNLIDKITELGGGVLLFSMEMSGIQIAERQVAGAGGLSTSKLKSPGQLEDEDWARISAGIGRMINRPIWVIDASELTVEQIKQSAIAHKRKHPELAAVFVDYLGLISVNERQRHDIAVGEVSSGLKALAKRNKTPVIALSQLSRGVEQRMNKRPVNADLKDSGSIEADADLIMMLYRDELYDENSPAKGIAEINLTKNRNGPQGTIYRQFRYGHFMPIDQEEAARRSQQQPEQKTRKYSGMHKI